MGISGLLPLVKQACEDIHIEEYKGKTVAIDAYVWLHKGSYGCAMELVEGKPTQQYVQYCRKKIQMLRHYGVKPFLVFDGHYLPAKMGKESEREEKRASNKAEGLNYLRQGNKSAAMACFQKCVDVSPTMAYEVIKLCKLMKVPFIVAPYEADAQLAFLIKYNFVDAILTEDSDLIPYGCETILFKLDNGGNVVEFKMDRVTSIDDKGIRFSGWTIDKIRTMCILAGCDYLPSLYGMGIRKAYDFVAKYSDISLIIRALRISQKWNVPPDYEENFKIAEGTFKHQRVFDPNKKKLVPLYAFDETVSDEVKTKWVGAEIDESVATQIANGIIDPITKEKFIFVEPEPETTAKEPRANESQPNKQSQNHGSLRKHLNPAVKFSLSSKKNKINSYFAKKTELVPKLRPKQVKKEGMKKGNPLVFQRNESFWNSERHEPPKQKQKTKPQSQVEDAPNLEMKTKSPYFPGHDETEDLNSPQLPEYSSPIDIPSDSPSNSKENFTPADVIGNPRPSNNSPEISDSTKEKCSSLKKHCSVLKSQFSFKGENPLEISTSMQKHLLLQQSRPEPLTTKKRVKSVGLSRKVKRKTSTSLPIFKKSSFSLDQYKYGERNR